MDAAAVRVSLHCVIDQSHEEDGVTVIDKATLLSIAPIPPDPPDPLLDHPIPPMTDPLSVHWDQPPRERVLVDDTHAIVSAADFKELAEYSASMPTGAYEGKMWKAHRREAKQDAHGEWYRTGREWWDLVWYGPSEKPGYVSNNYRTLLVAE